MLIAAQEAINLCSMTTAPFVERAFQPYSAEYPSHNINWLSWEKFAGGEDPEVAYLGDLVMDNAIFNAVDHTKTHWCIGKKSYLVINQT